MTQIRLAKKGEVADQKHIWKICFGDEDSYTNLYYSEKYKADETAVLLYEDKIVAMATMIPGRLIRPDNEALSLAMLYAVATHTNYQGKGFSTQIMDFCNKHLIETGMDLSILVPAEEGLFDFYAKRGYKKAFYVRELTLSYDQILAFKTNTNKKVSIETVEADDYNKRRRDLLAGNLYVDYNEEEIDYQKKVSMAFAADLYGINVDEIRGCAVIEWIDQNNLFIKEILMPAHLIKAGLEKIAEVFPAKNYLLRLPTYLGEDLGGIIKPFAMVKLYDHIPKQISELIFCGEQGYLGVAFD